MPKYDKQSLALQAKELGFTRNTLEKAFRLVEILRFINGDERLKNNLALKGGTAINLTIFNLPRLSVDIDLDFTDNCPREIMLERRAQINSLLEKFMTADGYLLSPKSKSPHSLDSFVYSYTNAAGTNDNIKIEINYSLRAHILPESDRQIETLSILTPLKVRALDPVEIFATKIVALLTRAAPRDLYDLNNMVFFGLFGTSELAMLRKCVVFYTAVVGEAIPQSLTLTKMETITPYKIKTQLLPVIRKADTFDLHDAQKRVHEFLSELLNPDEVEIEFLRAFAARQYRPELLFPDKPTLDKIRTHPMALWRVKDQ